MDDILQDFLTESAENLGRLDGDIVALERDPSNTQLLNGIFRAIHTIKGTCGFLELVRLETVAHAAESVLDRMRSGELGCGPDVISDVLRAVDVIKSILDALERTGAEPVGDDAVVIAALDRWMHDMTDLDNPGSAGRPAQPGLPDIADTPVACDVDSASVARVDHDSVADASLRVNVAILDRLMNMVGELVLARNQLTQLAGNDEESVYQPAIQHLNRITTELQESVMKTRLQPVGTAWGKLPRLVRDLSRTTGKTIALEMTGADTELDRQIVQAIQDPLTHMVRNSADHGIERPEVRRAAGKPEGGTIRLHAYHEGGHVAIEIADDGAGIDAAVIRRKAVERGLVRADVAEAMPDADVFRFVFLPGFSTAAAVTSVSGRGVGMDVVLSNIERIGGTVDITSQPGRGCTIRIRIPLTLAIISALLVGVAGETFAIPQAGITELVRVTDDNRHRVERIGVGHDGTDARFYRLRDTLLPLLDLARMLRIGANDTGEYNIVVCQAGDVRFGVIVDDVFDTQEIVVKPIGRRVKPLGCYAGCTIVGDGRVIMILDAAGVAAMGGVRATPADAERSADPPTDAPAAGDVHRLLVFNGNDGVQQAVPLDLVARLEDVDGGRVERSDGRMLLQYRGALLPLVIAGDTTTFTSSNTRSIIVCNDGTASLGLAVERIHDIVEDALRIELVSTRPGVVGTAVIAGRATEIVDVAYYLRRAHDAPAQAQVSAQTGAGAAA